MMNVLMTEETFFHVITQDPDTDRTDKAGTGNSCGTVLLCESRRSRDPWLHKDGFFPNWI